MRCYVLWHVIWVYTVYSGLYVPILSGITLLGPVVQSVVSLTSSLRVISLTVLADSIYNILIFFAEKMWVAFAVQKLLTFFQQKISAYLSITLDVNFNESLTNDVVSLDNWALIFSEFSLGLLTTDFLWYVIKASFTSNHDKNFANSLLLSKAPCKKKKKKKTFERCQKKNRAVVNYLPCFPIDSSAVQILLQ